MAGWLSPFKLAGIGIGLKRGDAVGQGGMGRVVSAVAAGQDAQPHGGVDIGRQAIPERAEKGVEVEIAGVVGVVGREDLAEERLNDGDLDQGGRGGAAAGDRGGAPIGPRFLSARHGLDQP